ncbi:unnamed protein product [Mytilus edulis]|uniref:Uncharacterized protein n=1 Tax=Mytilus edulis TaxID=6550 RepID=A0A8S3RKP2_MYTED|nr:unnamed protein product [Mytilus edulis]
MFQDEIPSDCYIATYQNKIYHTNSGTNDVICYDQHGKLEWTFQNENLLKDPRGIDVDSDGNVKYNILIYGIDDTKKDENVYAITRKLFSEDMHIDERKANAIPIANAHRVPTHGKGPKPIIVRFLHFGDKQLIMSNAHNLKGKKIRILDDLPISMKEERYLLSHNAYKIRKRDKLQTRIRAKGAHMTLETRKNSSEEWSTWG